MSLFDVIDKFSGLGGSSSLTGRVVPAAPTWLQPSGGGSSGGGGGGGGTEPARNSRERGVPERIDINSFVPQGFGAPQQEEPPMALQALEVAGRAPGFIAERPLALVDTFLGDEEGNSIIDALGQIGIGEFKPFSFAAEVVTNISNLPGAIANSSTADSLLRGTREGWSDDMLIETSLDRLGRDPNLAGAIAANPILAPLGELIENLKGEKQKGPQTWGEFKAEAAAKGWTSQDIDDLTAGRKGTMDFGDRAMSSDPLTELALRVGSDPFNLLFGAGALTKAGAGVGLLAKSVKAGAAIEKPLAPSLAALASRQGIAAESTWMGLAQYFGQVGRGVGAVPGGAAALEAAGRSANLGARTLSAYKKTALGVTAGQVGIGVVDRATEGFRGGFLEGLFQLNQEVWDNQPLSQNSAFMLFSAFHFDPSRGIGRAIKVGKAGKDRILGSSVREDVLTALQEGEGWGGKASRDAVLERLGGAEALDNLIVHTHAQIVFERLMKNPVIRASLSHFDSLDEAILSNRKLGELIERILVDEYKANKFTGKQTVEQLKRWHANRSGIDQAGVDFPWDGLRATDRWVEYSGAVAPVSQIFHERGDVVLGLVDKVMAEDLRNMGSALRVAGGESKMVPIAELRAWLSRFPQLTEDTWWAKFNSKEFDGQSVPYGPLQGKLSKLAKNAPTAREMTHEMGAAERAAMRQEFLQADPPGDLAIQTGGGAAVSRMRPRIAQRVGLKADRVDSVQAARGAAEIAAFEDNLGPTLERTGFPVDRVEQSIGAWEGSLEPSVQIKMSAATLPDLRLVAALTGRAGKQDSVALSVTGQRIRELGLNSNGFEVKIALPSADVEQLQQVASILGRDFPGFTINDTTGVVSILVPAGERATLVAALGRIGPEIEGLYPRDLIGDTGIATSVHPAYIEFITKKKGDGDGSYTEVIREARAAGDARADASSSVSSALAHSRGARADAGAGLGSPEAVGRVGRNARRSAGDPAQSPAERVGLGALATAPAEPGFLYHATNEEALLGIAQDGLRPFGAEVRQGSLAWPDGGTGKRTWFTDTPTDAVPYGDVLVRVRQGDAGRVRRSLTTREPYSGKAIKPALVEVYGADGNWYPASEWFPQTLEPDIAAGAQTTLPVFQKAAGSTYRQTVRDLSRQAFNLTEEQADEVATLVDARAEAWARVTGKSVDEWYQTHIAGIEQGGTPGELHQVADRIKGVEAAGDNQAAMRLLLEADEPPILVDHGLGGAQPIEFVPIADGRELGIPGGRAALNEGTFSLWDMWRLKAQGIDPNLIPVEIRVPLYAKMFRSQVRTPTPEDTFNRVTLAVLSPQNPLVRNEAGALGLRVRSADDIAQLADLADQGLSDAELGAAVAQLRPAYRAGGGPVTKVQLAAVAKNAQLFRDMPEFFALREGEDLLEYSERLMAVLHGSEMKVGNFAVMLGDPVAFGRGTIDSQIVKRLATEGRLPDELAARLRQGGSFDAPKARGIAYRTRNGEINPAVPAHLRDLPVEPPRGKVFVYDGDYRTINDALAAKLAEDGITDFGLGGYQWMEWDLQRKRLEPHTSVFPGTAALPLMEAEGLSRAVRAHSEAGYFNRAKVDGVSVATPMSRGFSPAEGLYYQDIQGSAQFLDDGRAILRGFEAADASTAVHEFAHVFRRELGEEDDAIIRAAFPENDQEGFARGFERWLRDGKAPTPELEGTFQRFRQWLVEIYRRLKGSPIEAKVSPEVRGVFERLFAEADDQTTSPFDPTPDPVTAGLRAHEDTPFPSGPDPVEAELLSRAATEVPQPRAAFDEIVDEARGVPAARSTAETYMQANGLAVPPRRNYQVDPDFGLRTARAYDALPAIEFESTGDGMDLSAATNQLKDAPVDDATRAAYQAFVDETLEQYKAIQASGLEIVPTLDDPYPDSAAMMADVRDNNRLRVFAGSAAHPILTDAQNVMFRGVHDYFAHAGEGNQFGPRGELNAAIKHSQMYSPVARKAMLAETHGQNSYVNYSDKVVDGRAISIDTTTLDDGRTVKTTTSIEGSARIVSIEIDGKVRTFRVEPSAGVVEQGLDTTSINTFFDAEVNDARGRIEDALVAGQEPKLPDGSKRLVNKWTEIGPRTVAAVNKAKPGTIYADQKAALLPDEIYAEFESNYIGHDPLPDIEYQIGQNRTAQEQARVGQVLWAAERDAAVSKEIPLHRSLSGLDDESKADLAAFERTLREHYPMYTLQKAPNPAIVMADRGSIAGQYLKERTALGDVVATYGPLGKVSRLLDWLRTPVSNKSMALAARQAFMHELLPHGAKVKEVDDFLSRLDTEASKHTIGPMGIRVFRNGTSLTQQTINRIAAGDPELGIAGVFSEKTIAAIGRDNFARVLDRASNRFIRSADEIAARGGRKGALARGLTKLYDGFAKTGAGDVSRLVSKTMYHWFRFISDPRWWAMNMLEADMIGGLKYGIGATRLTGAHRAEVGKPALFHQLGGMADSEAFERALGDGNGWMYTRRQGGYISRAFDHERPETVLQILRELPENDPIIRDLKTVVQLEDVRSGRDMRTEGEILDEDMVEAIDRLLYSLDAKGAKATVLDEARSILGQPETERLMPFLQKVWEANDKTFNSIVEMFHGNSSRTNLERIANSFWLYWPISYQIKATKWLVSVMTEGALGAKTNLGGAALYAHHADQHRKRLANDAEYVAMFEEHPSLWFSAQMLFPITPGDIGVSLSRPVRYTVGAAGDALEDATGSRLGLWGSYKSAEDPITAAGAILSMGPVYTAELLARIGREVLEEPTENLYP